jgi:hypothetical protein
LVFDALLVGGVVLILMLCAGVLRQLRRLQREALLLRLERDRWLQQARNRPQAGSDQPSVGPVREPGDE